MSGGGAAPAAGAETKAAVPEVKAHKESAITKGLNGIIDFFSKRIKAVVGNVGYALIDRPAQAVLDVADAAGIKVEHSETVGGKVGALVKAFASMVATTLSWPVKMIGKGIVFTAGVGKAAVKGALGTIPAGIVSTVVDTPRALWKGEPGHRDTGGGHEHAAADSGDAEAHAAHAA